MHFKKEIHYYDRGEQIVRQGILVSWESVFGVECSALHKCPLSVFDYLAPTVLEGLSMGNSD